MPTAARGSMARAAQVWVVFSGRSEALLHAYIACVAKNGYKLPTANTSGKGASVPGRHRPDRQIPAAATNCVSIYQAEFRTMYGTA